MDRRKTCGTPWSVITHLMLGLLCVLFPVAAAQVRQRLHNFLSLSFIAPATLLVFLPPIHVAQPQRMCWRFFFKFPPITKRRETYRWNHVRTLLTLKIHSIWPGFAFALALTDVLANR